MENYFRRTINPTRGRQTGRKHKNNRTQKDGARQGAQGLPNNVLKSIGIVQKQTKTMPPYANKLHLKRKEKSQSGMETYAQYCDANP